MYNGSKLLNAGVFSSYIWNDNSTAQTILVTDIGKYYLTVTDANGCVASDTTSITFFAPIPSNFLPLDTSICTYASVIITAKSGFENYNWNDNTRGPSLIVKKPGIYYLEVTDSNNCKGSDSILVSAKQCLIGFYIASAFTPNNDRRNDVFKPLIFGNVKNYRFYIYTAGDSLYLKHQILQKAGKAILTVSPNRTAVTFGSVFTSL